MYRCEEAVHCGDGAVTSTRCCSDFFPNVYSHRTDKPFSVIPVSHGKDYLLSLPPNKQMALLATAISITLDVKSALPYQLLLFWLFSCTDSFHCHCSLSPQLIKLLVQHIKCQNSVAVLRRSKMTTSSVALWPLKSLKVNDIQRKRIQNREKQLVLSQWRSCVQKQ